MCPVKAHLALEEADTLKVVLLIKGVCVCHGRPFDTSAALFERRDMPLLLVAVGSDAGIVGDVVL